MRSSVNPCGTSLRVVNGPHLTIALHAGDLGGGAAELSSIGHASGGSNRACTATETVPLRLKGALSLTYGPVEAKAKELLSGSLKLMSKL